MKIELATTCFVIGTTLTPVLAYAADSDMDRSHPATFVKDSVITTKIKAKLAAENIDSAKHIKIDTDKDGIVWMTGTANTPAEVEKAITIARNTEGVKSVHSDLRVRKDR